MQSTQQWGREEERSVQQEWKPFVVQALCAPHRPYVRIHALCALRLPACCSHSSRLLPRRAATRSQLVSKQPLALQAGSACARVPARKSAAHRLQRQRQRQQRKGCRVRSTPPTGNGKGKGGAVQQGRAVQGQPQPAQCKGKGLRCTLRSARTATAKAKAKATAGQCKGAGSGPSGSGAGGGGLFVARMGRLFFAPSKKFLNFSSASPAHCSPHSRTLQPTTTPAAAPTAAGHTGGIGHRGMA